MKNILTVALVAFLFLFVNTGCNDKVDADTASNTSAEVTEDTADAKPSDDTTQAEVSDVGSVEAEVQVEDVVVTSDDVTEQ
tara:strand:+ start:557 stop:799 length:243 start_codon:yes stop_codon:yes gene_type:complete